MKKLLLSLTLCLISTIVVGCAPVFSTQNTEKPAINSTQPYPPPTSTTASPTFSAIQTVYPIGTQVSSATVSPAQTVPFDQSLRPIILQAEEDLSQRLGIAMNKISVLKVEAVEWSDGSLGCPQPGMEYTQVITPGYRIMLEVNRMTYEYHSSRDVFVIYCENPNQTVLPSEP